MREWVVWDTKCQWIRLVVVNIREFKILKSQEKQDQKELLWDIHREVSQIRVDKEVLTEYSSLREVINK